MPKKYRFRKMFIICENNQIIKPDVLSTTLYQYKDYADTICGQKDRNIYMWDIVERKDFKVEAFYLVHESLYEKLLKDFSENEPEKK